MCVAMLCVYVCVRERESEYFVIHGYIHVYVQLLV